MRVSRSDAVFIGLFGVALITAATWLLLGLLPAIAGASDAVHDALHRAGGDGLLERIALNAAHSAHNSEPGWQVALDYLFSGLNLVLALVVVRLRPRDRNARLLAFGLVGTAVAFNLQGHDALQVVPPESLGAVDAWHISLHLLSGLSYIAALLLFPEGRLTPRRWFTKLLQVPVLVFIGLVFTGLSLMTTEDHTLGLVIVFGICIPVAGVGTQIFRYLTTRDEARRQQSRALLLGLIVALAVTVPLTAFTTSPGAGEPSRTVDYEVTIEDPGTYFFRCDPHPEEMIGAVNVVSGGSPGVDDSPRIVDVEARNLLFDQSRITLVAGRETIVRFTNHDADLHNVAIYETSAVDEPLFIGEEFSGNNAAAFAFRTFRLVFILVPIALFIGLIRFRLWDVDRVINRTLVYGSLAGFITVLYLGVVVGIGAAIGAGRRGNIALSIVVTAVVALVFQPLRERARRLANRVVYGRRATPYEVLSDFSDRLGDAFSLEEVVPEMARRIQEGTGARRAEVWLKVGPTLVLSGIWPNSTEPRSLPVSGPELPVIDGADYVVPVRHRGELLGALAIFKPLGDEVTPVEQRLLQDVASQAGLILNNARLAAELQANLSELRASRQRIVAAQDEERRRLERNIHDGAQQHLVGMSLKLRMAQNLAAAEPEEARALLEELQADATHTLESLRDLARGIYPPVLADRGVAAALEAHARRCPIEVRVEDKGIGRHEREIESAVYFCCLEAIQNAIKYAQGPVTVTVEEAADEVRFSVIDPGPGFDPATAGRGTGIQNMIDRVSALGGRLSIDSHPGAGTIVTGSVEKAAL
jgi:signal transduction histidine kinase